MSSPHRVTASSAPLPLIRPVFRTIIFGLLLGVLLISSGCRFPLVRSGQELENVPRAYTYSQGSTDYPHLYQQAVKHLEKNEFNQAEALYRDLIAKEPEGANGYIGLGTSLNLQERYMEAREAYETALAIAPDSVEALIGLAAAFVRQGLHPQAADTYRQALALDPENPNAHYGLGTVLVLLGEVEEGIEHYEKVIELAPNSGLAAQAENQVGELSQEGE